MIACRVYPPQLDDLHRELPALVGLRDARTGLGGIMFVRDSYCNACHEAFIALAGLT